MAILLRQLAAFAIVVLAMAAAAAPAADSGSASSSSSLLTFIFGDSLTEVGNNNFLQLSLAKSNYPFYGIDFNGGQATGRFTNGRTIGDIICTLHDYPNDLPKNLYLFIYFYCFCFCVSFKARDPIATTLSFSVKRRRRDPRRG